MVQKAHWIRSILNQGTFFGAVVGAVTAQLLTEAVNQGKLLDLTEVYPLNLIITAGLICILVIIFSIGLISSGMLCKDAIVYIGRIIIGKK